jgi:D-aminoacyl-tRNA deacylase
MRAVVQVVSRASVTIDSVVVSSIDRQGLVVLVGVTHADSVKDSDQLAAKLWDLRILDDERSASDTKAPIIVVSQFTLYADTRKGRRPSWSSAAPGPVAEPLFDAFCAALSRLGAHVQTGVFGAHMHVELVNDGPRTLILDTATNPSV